MKNIKAIFIGGSAGAVDAVQTILKHLPKEFSLPIVVVLHLPSTANINPALVFGAATNLKVFEAQDKMLIQSKCVYFAPPAYHLLIEKDFSLALSQDEPVHYSRPSIDVLFESAAIAYGESACGILLTGANADGAVGLGCIQKLGGLTVVQSPDEAESAAMPRAALALMRPDFVGTLKEIAGKMVQLGSVEATL